MIHKKRHLHHGSAQFGDCYTFNELLRYRMGEVSITERREIFNHLNVSHCSRCRQIYDSLPEKPNLPTHEQEGTLSENDDKCLELYKLRKKHSENKANLVTPFRLFEGQIWTTQTAVKDTNGKIIGNVKSSIPVMIVDVGNGSKGPENIIKIVPISVDINYFCHGRSVCVDKGQPLAYPFVLSAVNEIPMLAVNLGDYRGYLQKDKLEEYYRTRNMFLDGKAPKPDKELQEWEQREVETTEYLSAPVNLCLDDDDDIMEETGEIGTLQVELQKYSLAADDTEIDLSELHSSNLLSNDEFDLVIIQKRERLLLRFYSKEYRPDEIKVNDKLSEMSEVEPNIYELDLGHVDHVRKSIDLELLVAKRQFKFHCEFNSVK